MLSRSRSCGALMMRREPFLLSFLLCLSLLSFLGIRLLGGVPEGSSLRVLASDAVGCLRPRGRFLLRRSGSNAPIGHLNRRRPGQKRMRSARSENATRGPLLPRHSDHPFP
ncbi:hypothetical protein BDY21DRAFT_349044 [Lineolata rhizophorae]|uniref:Uncharacterized protein n=1 Tax=Lineolata rhizophorae TaxID=578093 RepID=A0A6A6NWH1_9PEZI|nr:hypothetical protein BDY21DRAFT_349044 [Lineolata rhizophorae]